MKDSGTVECHSLPNALRYLGCHSDDRGNEGFVHIRDPFVLDCVPSSVGIVKNPPLLWSETDCMRESLEDQVTVFGAVTVKSKCGQ